jgi:hypothetical protein
MFSGPPIGYSRDVDADVPEPPGQSAQQASQRKGLRALFGGSWAEDDDGAAADDGSGTDDAAAGTEPGESRADDAAGAEGTQGRADDTPPRAEGTQPGGLEPDQTEPSAAPAARVTTSSLPAARTRPAAATRSAAATGSAASVRPARRQPVNPLVSRPLINPRLRADPRLRVWVVRTVVALAVFIGFSIGLGWRYGVTAAAIYAAADAIYRSKTTAIVPAAVRVTSAQRYTRRRLKVLQPAGYMALHARTIPGTQHVVDHLVVGPAGVFTLDSQRLDKRLPLKAIGGMLYHGRSSMEDRMDHAQMEARQTAKLIAAEVGQRVRVKPAVVMYGPNIPWVIMKFKGVDVFDGSRVGTYFRRQSKATAAHRLTSGQIAMVFAAAARALPPLN